MAGGRMGYSQADHDAVYRVWLEVWLGQGGLEGRPAMAATQARLRLEGRLCPSKPTLEAWMAAEGWLERGRKVRQEQQSIQDRRLAAESLSGAGRDEMVETLLGRVLPAFFHAIEAIDGDKNISPIQRAKSLAELSTSMERSMSALGKASPAIDRLGVAHTMLKLLAEFVTEKFPQYVPMLSEILEPFGARLTTEFS